MDYVALTLIFMSAMSDTEYSTLKDRFENFTAFYRNNRPESLVQLLVSSSSKNYWFGFQTLERCN